MFIVVLLYLFSLSFSPLDTQEVILILVAVTLGLLFLSMILLIVYICIFQKQ